MSEEQDDSPTPPESKLKSKDLSSESAEHHSSRSDPSHVPGLSRDRNTAEISGEMIDVVGEVTGEFPREPAAGGGGESTGRAALMVGAGMLIATISRLFDLLYTGGAYG